MFVNYTEHNFKSGSKRNMCIGINTLIKTEQNFTDWNKTLRLGAKRAFEFKFGTKSVSLMTLAILSL